MSKKVLIVDDDVDFALIQKEILEKDGFVVQMIHSSDEALKTLEDGEPPDLIISDLMMEKDDSGFTLCHKLKRAPKTSKVPILMLTGVGQVRSIGFDLKSSASREWIKADDFAEKPVRPEVLLAKVRHLLGMSAEAEDAGGH
jgi:CheY-like chemotaxis protein